MTSDRPPPGAVFPPRDIADIAAYDHDQIVFGYLDQDAGEPVPGANSSPAYRWGATNRTRDRQAEDDGFNALRRAYLESVRRMQ